ncbi:MAG: ISNCY family transposase [Acidobacteria bacterium]|nr:ISNCY family transposase [Acidobacteriota bacterium]
MSQRELSRLELMQQVERKELTQCRAAELLGLSARQMKRLVRAYRAMGAAALISKRRGRASNHRLPPATVTAATALLRTRYADFGPTLAQEKLREAHGLTCSVESVRQWLIAEGLWQVRRAHRPVIHQLRERRSRLGELVQIDGSPHDWFEGRAPKCTLLVFIDDATGRLMELRFAAAETTFAYFEAVRSYITQHGKPLAFYSDKYGVFRVNQPTLPDSPTSGLTQFGRAMKELEIELICAHSPQAKGRVERANQTLQDRQVKELRLRGISGMEEANAFLPEFATDFNRRFAVAPRSEEDAHRPLILTEALSRILVLTQRRVLSKNLTLSYQSRIYQIETPRAAYTMRGAQVTVSEAGDGTVTLDYQGRALAYQLAAERGPQPTCVTPAKLLDATLGPQAAKPQPVPERYRPPASHPWKRGFFKNSLQAKERRGDICILHK